ncbi:hypothetical protein AAG906_004411 [Vitis piasezkii]
MDNKTCCECAMRELVKVILLYGRLRKKFYRVDSIGQLCSRNCNTHCKSCPQCQQLEKINTNLPVLPIPLPPPLSCVLEPAIPISTPATPTSDLLKPSQPQVANATLSTLSIMARLDTLQKLFMSMDSRINACLTHETMPILQTSSDAATKIFTSTIDIPDYVGQVDGEIFIHTIDTSATTPILEDIDQVATSMLEEIDGVVNPIIGA